MQVRFIEQILIGSTAYGADTTADLDERTAARLIASGVAVEEVREAVEYVVKQARKAVKRGGGNATRSPDAPGL